MSISTLYQICLSNFLEKSFLNLNNFNQLPKTCLKDILPYLSPYELERLDIIYKEKHISLNDLWRRHFELIWSLSRDDKDSYESIFNIPYKRLYFEYLFHDTQILQLGIYTHIREKNQSKSIISVSLIEHIKYNLTRDSIIYCSKRKLLDENENLTIIWNQQWNKYIKRFILVPHIWNIDKLNPLLIENLTDIILSGYPTENDYYGMKFILNILIYGHIENLILKFPSYCLMNILLPLLIYPRSYSLSYLSTIDETYFKQSNIYLPIHKRKLCFQVQIHSLNQDKQNLNRILSTNHHLNEQEDNNSNDTTHTIISQSNHSLNSTTSEGFSQTHLQSSHSILSSDNNRSNIEPHERLRPYLNRSRGLHHHSTLVSVFTPIRHISTSEQSVPTTDLTEPISSSDSNLFRHHTARTTISPIPLTTIENEISEEKYLILHITPENQINSLTNLSIYYISSIETIEMIAIALLGMNQIHHLTLVNFAIYSFQLETSLITLCKRSQLQTLHLTSITLIHGAIGFLLNLYGKKPKENNFHINLQRLRLDTIKIFALLNDNIHLSDVEQIEFIENSSLEQFIWREFFLTLNIQYILTVFHFERIGLTWNNHDQQSQIISDAFTSLILYGTNLIELSLAYNNLNHNFIQWLCQMLLINETKKTKSWWSIKILNLTFNLITNDSLQRLVDTLNEYINHWNIRHSPIRRIEILGNALELREIPNLKKQFNSLGCELISYILT